MAWKILVALLWTYLLDLRELLVQKGVIGAFEDHSWFFFKLIEGKVFNVPPHELSRSRLRATLRYLTIDCGSCTSEGSFSCTCILLEVFFKDLILLVLLSPLYLILDRIRDQAGDFKALLFLLDFFLAWHNCAFEVLGHFGLDFLELFFSIVFLLFNSLVLLLDFILILWKGLFPCGFEKVDDFIRLLLFWESEDWLIEQESGYSSELHVLFVLLYYNFVLDI